MEASIFIASMVATIWPAETVSPSATGSVTTPAERRRDVPVGRGRPSRPP